VASTDGSVAGAWRLPNVKELQSLIDFGQFNPAPRGYPFSGVQITGYWSSTSHTVFPQVAWGVNLGDGSVSYNGKLGGSLVWPVRGGP
jgi:hypothetical protein